MHQSGHPARAGAPAADGCRGRSCPGLAWANRATRPQVPHGLASPRFVTARWSGGSHVLAPRVVGHARPSEV